jgi:CheY-like chemotaxis protein
MPERILIADDSLAMREAAKSALERRGARVEVVADGTAALERVRAASARLLLADVHMPGLDGYALCREAKGERPDLRVLLMVGTFEPFDSGAATAARADAVLRKPFTQDELLGKVEELIGPPAAETPASAAGGPTGSDAEPDQAVEAPGTDDEVSAGREADGAGTRLSDDDVERIARRVLALGGERVLERVARELLGEAAAEAVRRTGSGGHGFGAPERE